MTQNSERGQPDDRKPVIEWYDSLDPCDEQPIAGIMELNPKHSAEGARQPEARAYGAGGSSGGEGLSDGHGASGPPEGKVPAEPRRPRRRIGWLGGLAVALTLWIVAMGGVLAWALRDVPWQQIADGRLDPVVVLEDSSGQLLVQEGPFRGAYASLDEFPQHLIDAVLSIEDRRFFDHYGIDLRGVSRAFLRNLGAGQVIQGGSTITQQLVKVLYLESDRTYRRKIQEAFVALWLEARLDKDEILTRYLNNIYLGAGATGVPAAARVYFDKSVDELDLSESAMIVGLIRSPSVLNPFNNLDGARQRASLVLDAMVANGVLAREEADEARLQTAMLNPSEQIGRTGSWFADWAMKEAREMVGPYRGTIRVRTTLVPELQEIAERTVEELMAAEGAQAGATQAALVAMRPDGAVLAMTGGLDYSDSGFNRAVQAMRQPGSAFKLFVYYAALRAGFDIMDVIEDAPIEIDGWAPGNFSDRFHGPVTLAEAFARSLNAATVHLAETVGIENVAAAARELGIDASLMETPSLALGTSEVNLLDLTGAYASVRAGVAPVEPWGIETFQAGDEGRSFWVGPPRRPETDISSYQGELVDLLRLVVEEGTGRRAAWGEFAAGKTGTSQNFRDAWFVGFTEDLVVGVWVGNDDGKPMNEVTGGGLPTRIWQRFVSEADAVSGTGGAIAGLPALQASIDRVTVGSLDDESAEVEVEEAQDPHRIIVRNVPREEPSTVAGCNIQACSARYRSFRASDCTYQPYRGPRRLCEVDWQGGQANANDARRGRNAAAASSFTAQQRQAAPAACNVPACSARYRSFRASDCTYQPYSGPRRLCEVGGQGRQANANDAQAGRSAAAGGSFIAQQRQAAPATCNVGACSRAYRSFRASDCTYQPYRGPRRLCTR